MSCHARLGYIPSCLLRLRRDLDFDTFLFWLLSALLISEELGRGHEPRSLMFITPGALDVVLRFLASRPATAESTFLRSDVSADIVLRWSGSLDRDGRYGQTVANVRTRQQWQRDQVGLRLTCDQWRDESVDRYAAGVYQRWSSCTWGRRERQRREKEGLIQASKLR